MNTASPVDVLPFSPHLEGDAGRIAQRLRQRRRALVLQDLLLDDGDGLRRIHQRLRELGR
jgi:predicted nucleic acid-binding protein